MNFYEFNLITYKYPPLETCTMHELEEICKERLHLYRIMDSSNNLQLKPNTKKWEEAVERNIIQSKLRTYVTLLKGESEEFCVGLIRARRNNHIAHWLLSLCYCRNSVLRQFFMCCELYWFVMLYKRLKQEELEKFLTKNDFSFVRVSQEEKKSLKNKLISCRNIKETAFNNISYCKTKFHEVANLVTIRKVFLYKGFAYFPETDIIFCVKNNLWKQFGNQLTWTNKMLPTSMKDERLTDFFNNMHLTMPTYRIFGEKKIDINLDNIDEVSEVHYPLCMKAIHNVLRKKHHLKYDCKMQYGVFLKCLGLSYEDAMIFWKTEFTKTMTQDRFDRKYAYLFKHQYGKVGGRLQYNPFSCNKILDMCPGPDQHHGCPFKHWDVDKLLQTCQEDGLTLGDVNDIRNLVTANKFKEACSVYFCMRHNVVRDEVINSPNEYFEKSYEIEGSIDDYFDVILNNCESEVHF